MLGWQARESSSILSLDAGGARQHAGDEARGGAMLKAVAGGMGPHAYTPSKHVY